MIMSPYSWQEVKLFSQCWPLLDSLDSVILLVSLDNDLQHALRQFAVNFEVARVRVSSSKSKAMVHCWKIVDFSQQRSLSILGSCS